MVPRERIQVLDDSFIGFLREEPTHSLYKMDVIADRDYYLRVYYDKLYSDDCPQFALRNNETQNVWSQKYSSV